ncbi:MAG: hypothetical protein PHQ78_00775 [Candidatus Cloacimonetes bacterium]|nr:hypothetical protein [Candidatus Cloacimonadota bacterium]MDD2505842.1 hypothetical protein [Candidatus Cloacimonadota bacterium]MDD4559471.1 hypothetical protein [Candidatus Cloacimonadota bacterium]
MRRAYRIVPLLLLLCLNLGAKHSDEFMIGTYSYLSNRFPYLVEHRETLSRYMHEMGYNSNLVETKKDDPDFPALLATLDKHEIDAWIIEKSYSDDPADERHYAISYMTTSSYQRFEAEYLDENDLHRGDSKDNRFWYASRNDNLITRTGRAKADSRASNGYVWQSIRGKDKPGYAMGDLRYRWPNPNGFYVRFGHSFRVYRRNLPTHAGNYLWVTYRFKLADIAPDVKPDTELLRFEVVGFNLEGSGFAAKATPLAASSSKGTAQEAAYTLADYERSRGEDGYVDFVLKIPYQDLIDANLFKLDATGVYVLDNLNARLYWQGNCNLELDYVEIEDQMSRELRSMDEAQKAKLLSRARNLISQGKGNVLGFYTFDEPLQPQFNSYRIMDELMAEEDINIMTAIYDYKYEDIVLDKTNEVYYDNVAGFISAAQPRIVAPDIYPMLQGYSLNPGAEGREFLQEVLNSNMLQIYEHGVRYCKEDPSRKFYPIIQAFGRWEKGDPDTWRKWVLPPYATQKALLYLPLVYQADGVLHYRLQSYIDQDGYGEYTSLSAIMKDGKHMSPVPGMEAMDAIMHSNPKVYMYGNILQDMEWLDAGTIMTKPTKSKVIPKQIPVKAMYVQNQTEAPYSGYIQCGYYIDADKTPYLMLVNRRGNYFNSSVATSEDLVPPSLYDQHYPQADPQTLHITLSPYIKGYSENVGLMDPYDKQIYQVQDGKCAIEIPAGEAKLLKLVNTLPSRVEGLVTLKGETIIAHDVTLEKGAKLKMHKDARVTMLPGARIFAPENTDVVLAGEIEMQGDSSLVIMGYLKEKNVDIRQDEQAKLLKQPQAKKSFFKRLFCID